jgi:hypothetical protein
LSLLSLIVKLSAPYAMAIESPKNLTFTSPSWQSRDSDFVRVDSLLLAVASARWPTSPGSRPQKRP